MAEELVGSRRGGQTDQPPVRPRPFAALLRFGSATHRGAQRLQRTRRGRFALATVPVIGLVIVWWAVTALVLRAPRVFPPPPDVAQQILLILEGQSPLGSSYTHAAATMYRVVISFSIAVLLGGVLGLFAGRVKVVWDFLDNIVWIGMAVPSIVWVFVFVVALGIGNLVPIAALIALITPMILANTAEGTKAIPKDLIEMCDAFKISRWQRIIGVYIPHVAPYYLAAARVGFAGAVRTVLVAEFIGLTVGIGYLVEYAEGRVFMAPVIAWGLLMAGFGMIVDHFVFGWLEGRVGRWRPERGKQQTILD